jgi:hypothetical protein
MASSQCMPVAKLVTHCQMYYVYVREVEKKRQEVSWSSKGNCSIGSREDGSFRAVLGSQQCWAEGKENFHVLFAPSPTHIAFPTTNISYQSGTFFPTY